MNTNVGKYILYKSIRNKHTQMVRQAKIGPQVGFGGGPGGINRGGGGGSGGGGGGGGGGGELTLRKRRLLSPFA